MGPGRRLDNETAMVFAKEDYDKTGKYFNPFGFKLILWVSLWIYPSSMTAMGFGNK